MAGHWSRTMHVIWWRDKGTGRMRVSFSQDKESLLRRLAKVWHADMDAALFDPQGERLPLRAPEVKAKKPKKKRAKKLAVIAPLATAA